MLTEKDISRFFSRIRKSRGCWLWTGSKYKNGYGAFSIKHKMFYAHRIAWLIEHNQTIGPLFILHHCDVRCCVNPKHLYSGSQADNMRDAALRGRTALGENNGRSILTKKEVSEIKKAGGSQAQIAKLFGVSQSSISRIKSGKQFKNHHGSAGWVSK